MRHNKTFLILPTIISMIVVCSIIAIILSSSVKAVGIGKYSNEPETLYQPGTQKILKFYLFDSPKIHVSLDGDLAKYATINDPNPDGPQRNVEVVINYPEYLEPGAHVLYIVATQATTSTATMGGIASVRTGIKVFALYPYKHPMFQGIGTNDLNIGEKTTIVLSVVNQGEEYITGASGIVTIYDASNQTVAILSTDTKGIGPYEGVTLNTVLDAALYNLTAGIYTAVGNVTYDDININYTLEAKFRVGELKVDVVDSTPELIINATNKYYVTLESDWAADITDVYALISVPNGEKSVKTANIDLIKPPGNGRKAAGKLEAYIETKGMSLGMHDINITVFYKGTSTTKTVKVNIIDGIPPVIDKPSKINTTIIFIVLGALIAISIIGYVLLHIHGRNQNQSSGTSVNNRQYPDVRNNTQETINDSDIRPPTL